MELRDTVEAMLSPDPRQRLEAEYRQTKIRLVKLRDILERSYTGKLNFELESPRSLLEKQVEVMADYLMILETRRTIE